jgi:predicted O-methyltransferase YrrM
VNWTTIEGWFSSADASFVTGICKNIHDGIVVELGFFAGRSTAVMAPICIANNTKYYAVDNCAGACERDPATKAQKSRDMKKIFEKRCGCANVQSW